ncbi:conserved hypothetical protein [delta proteobacterium NaphS2]|nr:conserved hypothetical protein [delta proteobacterium NaphS2]
MAVTHVKTDHNCFQRMIMIICSQKYFFHRKKIRFVRFHLAYASF